jgi:hypothetical protein
MKLHPNPSSNEIQSSQTALYKKKEKKGEGFDNTSWSNPNKI